MSRSKFLAFVAGVIVSATANAQTPTSAPTPATPPTPPTPATPWAVVPPTPLPPLPPMDFDFKFKSKSWAPKVDVDMDDFTVDMDDFSVDVNDIVSKTLVATNKAMKAVTRAPDVDFDVDAITATATAAATRAVRAIPRVSVAPGITTSLLDMGYSRIATVPQQGWAAADPADSLYRVARETLNRGEYRRAAQLFDQINQKYPNSVYAADSRYWKAFALYRIGSADDLREALKSLESGTGKYSANLQVDAPTLATRIRGALAARGDNRAASLIQREASQTGTTCDREDIAVRVEALNSLGQMDPESVMPMLRRLLQRTDECSAGLRRSALFLIARRSDAEAFNVLSTAAKSDPDIRVRADAIRWLARLPGDQAVATLEDIVRSGDNPGLQEAAVEALASSDSPRARQSVRSLIERTDVSENLRSAALQSIDAEHTDDGGAYLRSLYPRLDTQRLQLADVRAIARVGGNENNQWLLDLVRNPNASLDLRRVALGYAGRSTIAIGDLVRMYDSMADRPLREALISLYTRRTEPEATDKLIDIAKNGTDPELRRLAISDLSRKNDPRTKKLLLEIIDK